MPTLARPTQRGFIQLYPPGALRHLAGHLGRIAGLALAVGLLIGFCIAARP